MDKRAPFIVALSGTQKYQRVLSGEPVTNGMKVGHVCLQPGEEIGTHSTEDREEALVILAGTAQIVCRDEPACLAVSSSVVYIPPRTEHNVSNAGSDMLRYVYVVAPVTERICSKG
jgi:mannose-6-phosphate isomerase-like protein (cupin superfamily)